MPALLARPLRPHAPRGATLLELVAVLTLLGIAAVAVAPSITRRAVVPGPDAMALARRTAVQQATRVRLHRDADGHWALTRVADGIVLDRGQATDPGPVGVFDFDALGACVPAPSATVAIRIDPIACRVSVTSPAGNAP